MIEENKKKKKKGRETEGKIILESVSKWFSSLNVDVNCSNWIAILTNLEKKRSEIQRKL